MTAQLEFSHPRLVPLYNLLCQYDPGTQPEFYLKLARAIGAKTVVDLGCGTGIITCQFAAQQFNVIGVEPATAMLALAKQQPLADKVRWVQGGADALGPWQADLAIMTGHVAQFFLDDDAWHHALTQLHRTLRPGGSLAFETRNPGDRAWERWTADKTTRVHHPDLGPITCWSACERVDADVVHYTNNYRFENTGELLAAPSALRFRSLEALTRDLQRAGFEVASVVGDWHGGPVTEWCEEFIVHGVRG